MAEFVRRMGIWEQTFIAEKKFYGSLGADELSRLKHLEDEALKLKQLATGLKLGKYIL